MRIILNPRAGRKAGVVVNAVGRAEVEAALRATGVAGEVVETHRPGAATALAEAAVADGHRLVVAAGGDGTVREILPAVIGGSATLGILPLGSAMNLARALGIPRDLEAAVALLGRPADVAAIDVGQVNGRYFLEAAGVGVAAGVLHLFNHLDAGRWHRLRTLIRYLRAVRSRRLVIEADGRRQSLRTFSLVVANAPLAGAGVVVAPGARMDDGLLNARVFLSERKRDLAANWFRLALGRLPPAPDLLDVTASRLIVASRRPQLVHADDVLAGATPATFAVLPGAVRCIIGPNPLALGVTTDDATTAAGDAAVVA